jgi:hypothetical protein
MSSNSAKNDLVRKTLFPTPKDTERYFLRKDTSEKIHKDTHKRYFFPEFERYLFMLNHPHHFRHIIPKMYYTVKKNSL